MTERVEDIRARRQRLSHVLDDGGDEQALVGSDIDWLLTALARVRAIEERARQMLYVAGCRDDGINEEMRILWRVLGIDGAALEDQG